MVKIIRRIITIALATVFLYTPAYADIIRDAGPRPQWYSVDGAESGRPNRIVVTPDAVSFSGSTMSLDVLIPASADTTFLKLDGSNANTNIDISSYNLTTTGTITAEQLTSTDDINATDTITGATLTDGTLSINSGSITSAVNGTFSGTIQAEHLYSTDDGDINDNLTAGDIIIDEAAGVLDFTGGTSATISSTGAGTIGFSDDILQTGNAIYLTQTDGAEKIDSDADGDIDYTAGTSHDWIIGSTETMSLDAVGTSIISTTDTHLKIEGAAARVDADTPSARLHLIRDQSDVTSAGDIHGKIIADSTDSLGGDGTVNYIDFLMNDNTGAAVVGQIDFYNCDGQALGTLTKMFSLTGNDVIIPNDGAYLAFGAAGSTDSQIQWDSAGLDFYSSGGVYDWRAATNTDITFNFPGTTTSGSFKWMEDENYFQIADIVLLDDALYFTQTDGVEFIDSQADGYLDLGAGTSVRIEPILQLEDALYLTQTDGAEKIDSAGDGYTDLYAGTSIRTNAILQTLDAVYFTQTDGAEKIDSDVDGDIDYTAYTSHDFTVDATEEMTLTSAGLDVVDLVNADVVSADSSLRVSGDVTITLPAGTDYLQIVSSDASNMLLINKNDEMWISGDVFVSNQTFLGGVSSTNIAAIAGGWDPSSARIGHWLCNDNAANSTVTDESGNHNGSMVNDQNNYTSEQNATGKINDAFVFDGSNDFVSIADHNDLSPQSGFSIAMWVKRARDSAAEGLFSKRKSDNTQREYTLYWQSTDELELLVYQTTNNNYIRREANITISDTNWHHIVAMWDGSTDQTGITIYIDNTDRSGDSDKSGFTGMGNGDGLVGIASIHGSSAATAFSGTIDDVRFYDRELTTDEIDGIYNSGNGTEDESGGGGGSPARGGDHQVVATSATYISPNTLDSLADLAVEGELEVEGNSFFGGTLSTDTGVIISGDIIMHSAAGDDPVQIISSDGSITFSIDKNNNTKVKGLSLNIISSDTTKTLTLSEDIIECDPTTASFTVTLPTVVDNTGKVYHIKNVGVTANVVTADASGTERIDGELTQEITSHSNMQIIAGKDHWSII